MILKSHRCFNSWVTQVMDTRVHHPEVKELLKDVRVGVVEGEEDHRNWNSNLFELLEHLSFEKLGINLTAVTGTGPGSGRAFV